MVIIPAIDLLNGTCVRLHQGNFNTAVWYNQNPLDQAMRFAEKGATRIHIVDLNAARGQGNNRSWIQKIRESVPCVVEVGGGIRTDEDVKELVDIGVHRLIVGTVLMKNPDAVARWVSLYGNLFLAGIDARDGRVRVSGWEEQASMTDMEAAVLAQRVGAVGIVYTNIERDGTLAGPDVERTRWIGKVSQLPVILSGGVSSPEDVERAANPHSPGLPNVAVSESGGPGIVGVIIGKAIYEGTIELSALLNRYPQPRSTSW